MIITIFYRIKKFIIFVVNVNRVNDTSQTIAFFTFFLFDKHFFFLNNICFCLLINHNIKILNCKIEKLSKLFFFNEKRFRCLRYNRFLSTFIRRNKTILIYCKICERIRLQQKKIIVSIFFHTRNFNICKIL